MIRTAPIAEPFGAADTAVTSWDVALQQIEQADVFWLATVRPDSRPHVAPVLAIWLADGFYFCAGTTTHKGRNLAHQADCVLTTAGALLHLVIEGHAHIVHDTATLQQVAAKYLSRYGWEVTIQEGAFYAEGAPSAGPPPYTVYAITPTVAFGFGSDGTCSPTRWRFV
ncbi:MAG: pyridoxamine 5'-phosphate oxidase family protein [Chloroflexaceae bacterium]|nr:pyridoxamine 5'-phosphate oxidase family protein [Chloroflexaceae bacterium]NJO07673.1 pyridoxamine 5'-phosphate oxidase family protein [Chloroflexaceae bacterium]